MICEICGKDFNTGARIKLEGSVVSACDKCVSYGKVVDTIVSIKEKPKVVEVRTMKTYGMGELEGETSLADDYGERIKRAREKMKLKQSELAKLITEHESIVHRIESGKFEPDAELVKKLEHKLSIKLTVKTDEAVRFTGKSSGKEGERTLGDVVVVRKKGEGK
jgi:putative transcription factor